MVGPILVIVGLVAVIPAFLVGGGVLMAIVGHLFVHYAEATHEGSELIESNV